MSHRVDVEQSHRVSEVTIAYYDRMAEAYWDGNPDQSSRVAFRLTGTGSRKLTTPHPSQSQDRCERGLADLEGVTPQVVAVQFDQVEGVQEHVPVMLAVADTLE